MELGEAFEGLIRDLLALKLTCEYADGMHIPARVVAQRLSKILNQYITTEAQDVQTSVDIDWRSEDKA